MRLSMIGVSVSTLMALCLGVKLASFPKRLTLSPMQTAEAANTAIKAATHRMLFVLVLRNSSLFHKFDRFQSSYG